MLNHQSLASGLVKDQGNPSNRTSSSHVLLAQSKAGPNPYFTPNPFLTHNRQQIQTLHYGVPALVHERPQVSLGCSQFSLPPPSSNGTCISGGMCLDNFNVRDESTLDEKYFNVVHQSKYHRQVQLQSQNSSIDTFMPQSWQSYLQPECAVANQFTEAGEAEEHRISPRQPAKISSSRCRLISDFIRCNIEDDAPTNIEEPTSFIVRNHQTAICVGRSQILNSSALPDKFTKSAEALMGIGPSQQTLGPSESAFMTEQMFEFSAHQLSSPNHQSVEDDVFYEKEEEAPSDMLHYTSESKSYSDSGALTLRRISEDSQDSHEEEDICLESSRKDLSSQIVKMTVVDSQNLEQVISNSQIQEHQTRIGKRQIVEDLLPMLTFQTQNLKRFRGKASQLPHVRVMELESLDGTSKTCFRMYDDCEIGINLNKCKVELGEDQDEPLIDSLQDDDVNTDDEVLEAGTQQCFSELLVLRDYLTTMSSEQCRQTLKTFRVWAPRFNGQLPLVKAVTTNFKFSQSKIKE